MIRTYSRIDRRRIDSLKIEGRMKTALYVATMARTYRKALDDYRKEPELYEKICHGIWIKYPTARTASCRLDSSLVSRMKIPRSMTATLMQKSISIWDCRRSKERFIPDPTSGTNSR